MYALVCMYVCVCVYVCNSMYACMCVVCVCVVCACAFEFVCTGHVHSCLCMQKHAVPFFAHYHVCNCITVRG